MASDERTHTDDRKKAPCELVGRCRLLVVSGDVIVAIERLAAARGQIDSLHDELSREKRALDSAHAQLAQAEQQRDAARAELADARRAQDEASDKRIRTLARLAARDGEIARLRAELDAAVEHAGALAEKRVAMTEALERIVKRCDREVELSDRKVLGKWAFDALVRCYEIQAIGAHPSTLLDPAKP